MLSKLLKRDLYKNMHWLWILFVATIGVAGITRGCKELGESIAFFRIMGIFFDSVFYALAVNVVLQPFLRNFLNFKVSFYSDESYLTHTLPVTKNQLLNSKYLTAIIEIVSGFACLVASILIMYATPNTGLMLQMLLSTIVSVNVSVWLVVSLFVVLIIVEFLMFISIIYFGIVMGFKSRDHKVLKSFIYTAICAMASIAVLAVVLVIVFVICGIELTTSTLMLSSSALFAVVISAIVIYLGISTLFYFLTRREFNKGVNVD